MRFFQNALILVVFLNVPFAVWFIGYMLMSALDGLPLWLWLLGCLSLVIGMLGFAAFLDDLETRNTQRPDR
jgi:hypothetical protein